MDSVSREKKYIWSHIIMHILLVLSGITWGIMGIFYYKNIYIKISCIIIGIVSLYTGYFTFLGWTVFPTNLLLISQPKNANLEFKIHIPSKRIVKVIYWAEDDIDSGQSTTNIGVSSVENESATIHLRYPGKNVTQKHFHYRFVYNNNILSNVHTYIFG